MEKEAEILESTPLEANKVSDNVIIEGATKEDGTPPTPNEAISLDISNSGKTAFLNEGFDISLSSDGTITGAYLQIKANDGTVADSYYDIDIAANMAGKKGNNKRFLKSRKGKLNPSAAKTDGSTLDVDFTSQISPGTFCYVICVYDAQGNISAPQEICVTVESWGGSADAVGTWNIVKEVETVNGVSGTILPGEEECSDESTYDCESGGQFTASYDCYTTGSFTLIFNENGTYKFYSQDTEKELDLETSQSTCEATYEEFIDAYTSKGSWAYVKEEKKLVMVEYEYTEEYQGETTTETYEPGDAYPLFEGVVELNGNSLIITIEEGVNDTYKIYMEK